MTTHRSFTVIVLAITTMGKPVRSQAQEWEAAGAGVITHQQTSTSVIANETAGSADLMLTRYQSSSSWVLHLEASSSLDAQKVASNLPEANTDAGSALNKDSKGRLQLSELYYQYRFSSTQQISVGLLDMSGFFEQSRIASDETTQFLGTYFTGNPLIEFQDYTLGMVYEHELVKDVALRAAVSSSNGLADNSTRSYNDVLSITELEKGVFAITSL